MEENKYLSKYAKSKMLKSLNLKTQQEKQIQEFKLKRIAYATVKLEKQKKSKLIKLLEH
jgi:hypothetical protein